jgi:diacylglycerol O-acyltransferase / wax synthase
MTTSRMDNIDRVIFRADNPHNPIQITGIILLERGLDFEVLKTLVEQSILPIPKFRQHPIVSSSPFGIPSWEDDPNLKLTDHVHSITIKEQNSESSLKDFISQLMSQPMNTSRAMWDFYLVENYFDGRAIIVRLHHSIGDGVSLLRTLLSISEGGSPESMIQPVPQETETNSENKASSKSPRPVKILRKAGMRLLAEGYLAITDQEYASTLLEEGLKASTVLGNLFLRPDDSRTFLSGDVGIQKRVTWSEPFRLDEIKVIGKAFGSTVNDVFLSLISGAISCYADSQAESLKQADIHAFLPVYMLPFGQEVPIGNHLSAVFVHLPVDIMDPVERLLHIHSQMDIIKSSPEAIIHRGVLDLLGITPTLIQDLTIDFLGKKFSTTVSSVPGPREKIHLAGVPINTVIAWVPQLVETSLGISLITYNNLVRICVASDESLIPNPEIIAGFFPLEFEKLQTLAKQKLEQRRSPIVPSMNKLNEAINKIDAFVNEKLSAR